MVWRSVQPQEQKQQPKPSYERQKQFRHHQIGRVAWTEGRAGHWYAIILRISRRRKPYCYVPKQPERSTGLVGPTARPPGGPRRDQHCRRTTIGGRSLPPQAPFLRDTPQRPWPSSLRTLAAGEAGHKTSNHNGNRPVEGGNLGGQGQRSRTLLSGSSGSLPSTSATKKQTPP